MRSTLCHALTASVAILAATLCQEAAAGVATALVRSGGPLPGTALTVQTVHMVSTNSSGGYIVHVTTTDGIHRFWGAPLGGAPSVFRSAPSGSAFDPGATLGEEGSVLYVLDGPGTGDRQVWRDDTMLASNGDSYSPIPGSTWIGSQFHPVALPATGPIWAGALGPTWLYGLFPAAPAEPFLLAGDTLPGIPEPIANPRWQTFRVSGNGAHSTGIVNVTGDENEAFVVDGEGATAAGAALRLGVVIPPELGGDGSLVFGGFIAGDINDAGQWIGGYFEWVSDPEAFNEVGGLLENGVVIRRPDDAVDGVTLLGGPVPGARINAEGDILSAWITGTTAWNQYAEALDLRHGATERLVLRSRDEVDLDGDLVPESGAVFFRLWYDQWYPSNLALSNRAQDGGVTAFAKAWVDTAGTTQYPWQTGDDIVAILRIDTGAAVGAPAVSAIARRVIEVGPNPMVERTEFVISLDRPTHVELTIYDVRGVRIARVLDETRSAGVHRVAWDAASSAPTASGLLFYRARLGDAEYRGKLVRLR